MKYRTVAEAYRDLEQASGRLALIDRLAALVAATPAELLPTVCYLCQGLIAPEFAGVDLGLAEKLAVRAVAATTGARPEQVAASVRETGDLGQAAEQLLTVTAAGRPPSLEVAAVVAALHEIAEAEGPGSQGRKLDLLAGLLGQATPLEARYLLRLVTGNLRLGIGTPTILDALAQVYAGGRAARPALERAYNICCDLGLVAATLVGGGVPAVEQIQVRPGSPVRAMLAQRLSDPAEILAKLGGQCAAEYKYDGVRVQAHRTADGTIELFTRRLERVAVQFPDVVELLAAGLGPREAIVEGEVVAFDPAAGELHPFGEVMLRRRKHGISEAVRDVPVGLFCFELLYADGQDLTMLSYPQRRAALAKAITVSPRLRLTTATQVRHPGRPGRGVRAGGHRRLRRAGVQVGKPGRWLPGRRARLAVDQTQAGLPHGAVRHHRPGHRRRVRRARPPGRRVRRAAACRLRPRRRRVPDGDQVRHRVRRRRAGRAARPAGPAGPARPVPPGSTRASNRTCGSSPGSCWKCSAPSSPSRRTTPPPGVRSRRMPDWRCGSRGSPGGCRDDKAATDATTTDELIDLYRTAHRAPARA